MKTIFVATALMLGSFHAIASQHAFYCQEENGSAWLRVEGTGEPVSRLPFTDLEDCEQAIANSHLGVICSPEMRGLALFSTYSLVQIGEGFQFPSYCFRACEKVRSSKVCAPFFGRYRIYDIVTGLGESAHFATLGACERHL